MTARERATKICDDWFSESRNYHGLRDMLTEELQAHANAALEEAKASFYKNLCQCELCLELRRRSTGGETTPGCHNA